MVPARASCFALGLKFGQSFAAKTDMRAGVSLGVTEPDYAPPCARIHAVGRRKPPCPVERPAGPAALQIYAQRFCAWNSEATLDEFRTFSGLGVEAAKAAMDSRTVSEPVDFAIAREPQYALVGSMNNMVIVHQLESHATVDRGRLVGLWDSEQSSGKIVWRSFWKPNAALRGAVARTEAFIREDLGDARAFSLDPPASRGARIEVLRREAHA